MVLSTPLIIVPIAYCPSYLGRTGQMMGRPNSAASGQLGGYHQPGRFLDISLSQFIKLTQFD